MKKLLVLAAGILFVFALSANAGEYHMGSSLSCYQCHVMHYSQSHGYGYTHDVNFLGTDGPYNYLLRDHVNNLCLNCHDQAAGGHNLDVYQDDGTYPLGNRQAGFLNRLGDVNENSGHTLDYIGIVPGALPGQWEATGPEGLTCVNCHQQHGYFGDDVSAPDPVKGQYRNLLVNPGNVPYGSYRYVSYDKQGDVGGYPNPAFDVNWRSTNIHDETSGNQTEFIDFYEPNAAASNYGAWCQSCHTEFHGNSGDSWMHNTDGWLRHPTAEANIGATGGGYSSLDDFSGHLYRPQVMSTTGDWGVQGEAWVGAPADLTPSCFTCHKAHGNNNAFGLIYMTGNAPRTENGDGTATTDFCKVCHVQGG